MKGLFLKDVYIIWKQYRFQMILILGFAVMSVFAKKENAFLTVYPCLFAGLIPTGLLGNDENSKWNVYCGALPYTKDQLVAEKYIISAVLAVILSVICTFARAMYMVVNDFFDLTNMFTVLCTCVAVSSLSAAASLPFVFKYGVEKGRIAYFISIGVFCGGSVLLSGVLDLGAIPRVSADIEIAAVLICAVGVALFGLSWYVSTLFYRKREL